MTPKFSEIAFGAVWRYDFYRSDFSHSEFIELELVVRVTETEAETEIFS